MHPLRSFVLCVAALVVAVGLLAAQPSSASVTPTPDGAAASGPQAAAAASTNPVAPAPAPIDPREVEVELLRLTNELRAERGLPALAEDRADLTAMAREWAATMAEAGEISHRPDLEAAGPADWVRLGENVGVGHGAGELHDAFVASPLHLANLVDPDFESMSVGAVVRDGRVWVTQQFLTAEA